jgi:flagellar FliJ protein
LQPVLHHRQKKEDIHKKELAEAKLLFERQKAVLDRLKSRLSDLQMEIRLKQQSAFDASEAVAYSAYMERIEREIEVETIKLADIASEVRRAQERLLESSKDKKILEKLHDKKLEEHKKESDQAEQSLIDEMATMRHNRNNSLLKG